MKNSVTAILILFSFCAYSQQESIDDVPKLRKELLSLSSDTSVTIKLSELAEAYRWSNPDSSIYFARKALSLAREINYDRGEAKALISLSVIKREFGLLPESIGDAIIALRIGEKLKDNRLMWGANIRIANAYYLIQNYETALDYYRASIPLSKSLAEFSLQEATLLLSARCFAEMGFLDSANYYVEKSLMIGDHINDISSLFFTVEGKIFETTRNYHEAILSYKKGIANCMRMNNYSEAASLHINLSIVFRQTGEGDSTIWYAKIGQRLAEKIGHWEPIIQSSKILAEEYKDRDSDLTIVYYEKLNAAKDSLFSMSQLQSFQDIVLDDQQKQYELEVAKKDFQYRLRRNALFGVSFTFLIIVLFLFRNNRLKQKAKTKIQDAYDLLKSTQSQLIQSEKMASLGELTAGIAHEIQNPLNFVNNFSEVNDELLDDLKEAIANNDQEEVETIYKDLKENEQKIKHHGKRAEGIVRGMLEHSRTSEGKKELTDINVLADEYLRLAYHGLRAKDKSFNAEFKTDLDPSLPKIEVIPQDIGRVLLNLINNAFYAVDKKAKKAIEGYQPEVVVSTKKLDQSIEIIVSDNGPGIPDDLKDKIFQPFFTTKPTGSGTGLGLSLSYDIVKAHGGEIMVESRKGEGSDFNIHLPINKLSTSV